MDSITILKLTALFFATIAVILMFVYEKQLIAFEDEIARRFKLAVKAYKENTKEEN